MTTREYRDYRYGQLLAMSDPRLTWWSEESTATAADPIAGQLQQVVGSSSVVWTASGAQVGSLEVRAQTGGYPGAGATYATRSGAALWRGWDPPYIVQQLEPVAWDATLATVGERVHPRMIRLPDDRVLLVCEDSSTSGQTSIIVATRSAAGVWGNELTLATLEGDDAWPDVVVTDTEPRMVRVYALVHDASLEASNVWMWEASVDADLSDDANWESTARGVLDADLAWADELDTVPTRLRAALGSGSGLLLVQVRAGRVAQYATRDDGYSWESVGASGDPFESWGSIGYYDMIHTGAAFIVAGLNTDTMLRTTSVYNPWVRLEDRLWREVHEPEVIATDCVLMAEDAGTVWLWLPDDGASPGRGMVWRSPDAAQRWFGPKGDVDGRQTSSNGRGAILQHEGATNPALCWLGDRALLVSETPNAAGYAGSLLGVQLGGWTTLPVPARSLRADDISRRAWTRQWWPHQPPASAGLTQTDTGTPAAAWTADGSLRVQTDAAERRVWSYTPAGVEYGVAVVEAALDVDAGGGRLYAEVTVTGGSRYIAWLDVSSTGATLVDGTGPTTIGSAAMTGVVAVRLVISGSLAKAWWRQIAPVPGDWQAIDDGTLSAAGGAGALVEVSTEESSDVYWHWVSLFHADSTDVANTIRQPQVSSWSTPRDVIGRSAATPTLTDTGASIAGNGGPMRPGDEWQSEADAFYSPRRMIARTGSDVLRGWRSTGLDDEILAWQLGEEATHTGSPIWALHWRGDAQALHVAWHDGTSWGAEATVVLYELVTMTRQGRTLVGTAASAVSSGTWVERDELRGGMVYRDGLCRRILGNTEGMLRGSTSNTWQQAVIEFDGDGTEDTGSNSWRIVWPEVVVLLEAPEVARGIRVRVGQTADVAHTPTGYHAGVIGVLGPAHLLGLRHERDSYEVSEPLLETAATQAGPELRRARQARRRVVEVSWQRTHDRIHQIGQADAAAPDYITPWADGRAGYSRGSLATTIRAIVERAAEGAPVLYVPSYDREAALVEGVEVLRTGRAGGAILGQIDPSWRIEHAGYGDERRDATIRLGSLRLVELPRLHDDVASEVVEQLIVEQQDGPI